MFFCLSLPSCIIRLVFVFRFIPVFVIPAVLHIRLSRRRQYIRPIWMGSLCSPSSYITTYLSLFIASSIWSDFSRTVRRGACKICTAGHRNCVLIFGFVSLFCCLLFIFLFRLPSIALIVCIILHYFDVCIFCFDCPTIATIAQRLPNDCYKLPNDCPTSRLPYGCYF